MTDKPDQNQVTIEPKENGPLLVKGLKTLKDAQGNPVEIKKDVIALCRCGASSNKPFCDGTHKTNGFTSAREISKPLDRERAYRGKSITVHDNRTICSHAAYCVKELKTVFKKDAQPWINPDGDSVDAIIRVVEKCPSGALSYEINDDHKRDVEDRDPQINFLANGPYNVCGHIHIESELQPPSAEHFSLCRCGASKNKPFCDGAHYDVEFDQ